jgi:N-acylneuraminate cytidylyltransferase
VKSNVFALILAKSGSKRIQNKNKRLLLGHRFLAYSIEQAKRCNIFEDIIVSTNDPEIADIAVKYGANVPSLRPSEFAVDSSPDIEWVIHAMTEWLPQSDNFKICILRPTSPLRTPHRS